MNAQQRIFVAVWFLMFTVHATAQIGKVGINTTAPAAMLHVKDSSVVFTGTGSIPGPSNPPVSEAGTRMMWYPDKAAFRVGNVSGSQWNKDSIGLYSTALGQNTKAKGVSALAMGNGTTASGNRSTAMGSLTTASGFGSTAMGDLSKAIGLYSIAMGQTTTASGHASIAMGQQTTASGITSTAMGYLTNASGDYSTSIGRGTLASGERSTAMGGGTFASGFASTAMGYFTNASGDYSTTVGHFTKAKSYASVSLGQFNDTSSISSTLWNLDDPVFIIGNGTSSGNLTNAFTVLKNAKTGISIASPLAGLHIKGVEATFDAHIRLETAGAGTDYANILYDGNMKFRTFAIGDEYQWRNSANNTRMTLQDDGDLLVDGTVTASCGVLVCSDIRYKKNICPLTNSLSNVLSLHGMYYDWDKEKFPAKAFGDERQIGFSAQEIESVFPEMVQTDESGYKSVDYSRLTPVLVEAIKEQQEMISSQQVKLDSQQLRLETLEKEMQLLKSLSVNR